MKKNGLIILLAFLMTSPVWAQTYLDSTVNSATKRIFFADPQKLSVGSYGEAHYNAPIEEGKFRNGKADLHRIILFMGYKFNSKLQFFTEIEFEHVKEVYVEQAFLDYSFNSAINLKAGMLLIPMGYVNEFHEPTLFNGVERPSVDKDLIPTTWRELGFGLHGLIKRANLKYQVYVVNGFNGYDNGAKLSGGGLRGGRQKGAEAVLRTPAVTGKLTFFGLNGLRVGLSGYSGTSETSMYNGLDRNDAAAIASADSTRVGILMAGTNIQYNIKGLQLMVVGNYTKLSNVDQYNGFTGANLAKDLAGYYGEISYKLKVKKGKAYPQMIPFVRYEHYDTHYRLEGGTTKNLAFDHEVLTAGLGFQITPGTIVKTDYQWVKTAANPRPSGLFNLGFGYWF